MATNSDLDRFLQAVIPDYTVSAIFANLNPPKHTRDIAQLDLGRDCYYSIAGFAPTYTGTNTKAAAVNIRALVIDDVGTKVEGGAVGLGLGRQTAVVETSLGNYQWVYRLEPPAPVSEWPRIVAAVEMLCGARLDARNPQTLVRLPIGVNTKPGRGLWHVRLERVNPGVSLDWRILVGNYGGFPTGPGPSGRVGKPSPRVRDIRGLLELIPNNDEPYDTWMDVLQRSKALALDEEAAREAAEIWSSKSLKHDPDEFARRWDTVSPTRTTGLELEAQAEAADPEGYRAWKAWEARDVFDDGAEPPETPPRGAVKFELGEKKQVLKSMENAKRALVGLGIGCRYDAFHHRVIMSPQGALSDHLVLRLRDELKAVYGVDFGPVHVLDAVTMLALANEFNPVVDMLAEAEASWDGVARLDRLGPDYFHTEDTALARACFRKVMLAAVRRARRPGVKFDQILVTESPEGWDKSTAWAVLAGGENFSDADILGKDARAVQEELADVWIHEIADLSGLSKAEVEHVKAFASRTNDRARPAYGRVLVDQPRQNICVGTTNADTYLLSQTGNRRFWPFKLSSPVDLARLRADRLQLWGEAARAEAAGETLVLDGALWGVAAVEQEKRRVVDTWEDELAALVEMPANAIAPTGCERIEVRGTEQFISSVDVHRYLGDYRRQALNSSAGRKIAEIMTRLGWDRAVMRVGGVPARGYKRARPAPSGPGASSVNASVTPSVTENLF